MATIQLRRKTTSGSGPLTGTSGTIKQGEPLIDLNGGNLYIAKANKTGSSSNPLSASDYLEFVSSGNLTGVLNSKIDELKLGSAEAGRATSPSSIVTASSTIPSFLKLLSPIHLSLAAKRRCLSSAKPKSEISASEMM